MSKVVYIPVKVKDAGIKDLMDKVDIKEKYGIVTTVQYLDEVKELDSFLGQILGCNIKCVEGSDCESFLYIGTGLFHPLNLAFQTKKKVYILDPMSKEFSELDEKYLTFFEKRKKGMLLKYLNSKKIGILVSTKNGQCNMKKALEFKEKCGKEAYIFMCNEIKNLEDFNDIECWVNTACIRIFEDDLGVPMINIGDIDELNKG